MSTLRDHALAIWHAAVAAADPFERVRSYLSSDESPARRALAAGGGVFVFGGGKAGPAMARGVEAALAADLDRVSGVVNVPGRAGGVSPLRLLPLRGLTPPARQLTRIDLWPARPAGSNHPTDEGVRGTDMQLALAELLRPEDLALCLLSGGGSALLPAPVEGVSLLAKQEVTRLLHACGATINEMNCVRKHLSRYKGGRLAQVFAERGCRAVSLIVSDVVGDPLDVIASGPTAADPTTFADARAVLTRYHLADRVPASVNQHLDRGAAGAVPDTPKAIPASIENVVLCNNAGALANAAIHAEQLGYRVLNLGSFIEGETRDVATALAGIVRAIRRDGVPLKPPACILSGGETTVTLGPNPGKGGRNQEFALASLIALGSDLMEGVAVLSAGTDGEDGPTDAAGAVVDYDAAWNAGWYNVDPRAVLERHDAYTLFDTIEGALIRTGLTGTNVMDVRVILVR